MAWSRRGVVAAWRGSGVAWVRPKRDRPDLRPTRSASGSNPRVAFRSLGVRSPNCGGWRQRRQSARPSGGLPDRRRRQGRTASLPVGRSGAAHSRQAGFSAIVGIGTPDHLLCLDDAPTPRPRQECPPHSPARGVAAARGVSGGARGAGPRPAARHRRRARRARSGGAPWGCGTRPWPRRAAPDRGAGPPSPWPCCPRPRSARG